MKKTLLIPCLITIGFSFGQSKKEQIELLSYQLDSLKKVTIAFAYEKNLAEEKITLQSKDIEKLNDKISNLNSENKVQVKSFESEIDDLKNSLKNETDKNKKLSYCNTLLNFDTLTKIYSEEELITLSKCTKSEILKSFIFERYYEIVFGKWIKNELSLGNYNVELVINVVNKLRRYSEGPSLDSNHIYKINKYLSSNNGKINDSLLKYLSYNYFGDGFLEGFPELTISPVSERYFQVFYNYSGAGEGNHFILFENVLNTINEINLDDIETKISNYMKKKYGQNSYVGANFNLRKINNNYEVIFEYYKENDANYQPSILVKINTLDFKNIEGGFIEYGNNLNDPNNPWKVEAWKK